MPVTYWPNLPNAITLPDHIVARLQRIIADHHANYLDRRSDYFPKRGRGVKSIRRGTPAWKKTREEWQFLFDGQPYGDCWLSQLTGNDSPIMPLETYATRIHIEFGNVLESYLYRHAQWKHWCNRYGLEFSDLVGVVVNKLLSESLS